VEVESLRSLLKRTLPLVIAVATTGVPTSARADAVTDWSLRAGEFVSAASVGTPPACRMMAISHTAAFEAVNAITRRYPSVTTLRLDAPSGASVEAAIAAAHRAAWVRLLPSQQSAIESAYRTALSGIADGAAKDAGIAVGERAALQILAQRADDGIATAEAYRPVTARAAMSPLPFPPCRNGRCAGLG
jgi:hypothetical protein